jgi:hypothetical protein
MQPDAGSTLPDGAGDAGMSTIDAAPLGPDASPHDKAVAAIEATYPQPCGMFDGPYCGSVVQEGNIFTYPLYCVGASSRTARDGSWTLAANSTCTNACPTPGVLCPR